VYATVVTFGWRDCYHVVQDGYVDENT